ncbi:MAG: hypothetical protein OHK0024_19380 [Thalassobaculales bacterium]
MHVPNLQPPPPAHGLLWTGGFDSTFRLLDLALTRRQPVTPVYVIDLSRLSWSVEITAQHAILTALERLDAGARALVGDHLYLDRKALRWGPDPAAAAALAEGGIGQQALWLSQAKARAGLPYLEQVIDRGGELEQVLGPHLERTHGDDEWRMRLRPDAPAELALFAGIDLAMPPLLRNDLPAEAERRGYTPLLALAWCCYRPVNGRACGQCRPCRMTLEDPAHRGRLLASRRPVRAEAVLQMTYAPGRPPPPAEARPLRPLIGYYIGDQPAEALIDEVRTRALAAEAALQGADFGIFAAADVDIARREASYTFIGRDGQTRQVLPLPDAVMEVTHRPTALAIEVTPWLRRELPWVTATIGADKLQISEGLRRTRLAPHVIPFARVDAGSLAEVLTGFLAEHPASVLKPANNGYRGRSVIFLTRDGGDLVLREGITETRLPLAEAIDTLRPRLNAGNWMLQRFIVSRARGGRTFDVRVHVHKDGNGNWCLVRSYVRLSEEGLLVSNTARGGYQGDVEAFFAGLGQAAPALIANLRNCGLAVARIMDRGFAGAIDELGVDLMVDPTRRIWITEVNTRPGSRHHEFERARYAIAYAMFVARGRIAALPASPVAASNDDDRKNITDI